MENICTTTVSQSLTFDHVTWKSVWIMYSLGVTLDQICISQSMVQRRTAFVQRYQFDLSHWPEIKKDHLHSKDNSCCAKFDNFKAKVSNLYKDNQLFYNFNHVTWKSIWNIFSVKVTLVQFGKLQAKGTKDIERRIQQFFLSLWPCILKISRDHLLSRSYNCT